MADSAGVDAQRRRPARRRHRGVRRHRLCRLAVASACALAAGRGPGARSRSSPATRSSRSAPAAPTPAFMPSARSSTSTPLPCARRAPGCLGANTRLPPAIALQWAGEVTPGFHARHTALRRVYRYYILNCSARSALHRDARRVDSTGRSMPRRCTRAAQALLGEHDFSAFRSVECQSKTSVQARRAAWWCSARAIACGWRSRRTRICTTWCATSSARCSRCSARRTRSPPWRAFSRGATGAWPAQPRRPRACICGEWNIRPLMAFQRPS